MKRQTFTELLKAKASGSGAVLATNTATGEQEVLTSPFAASGTLARAAANAFHRDQSSEHIIDGDTWFLTVFSTPIKLYVIGAVHIAQPLAHMAALNRFDVTVIDPRTGFASSERFPNLRLLTEWPDEALARLPIDARTAIVTLTHDPKLDDPALSAALRSSAFYIGALGSKKTHTARRERLLNAGFAEADITRIHGPVGLDIHAVSPPEIAVSILAQLIACLRAPST